MPTRRLVLVVLFFLTAVSIALLSLYLYKNKKTEFLDYNKLPISKPNLVESGSDGSTNFDGPLLKYKDETGKSALVSIEGIVSDVSYKNRTIIIERVKKRSKVVLKAEDEIMIINFQKNKLPIRDGPIPGTINDVKLGMHVSYNPSVREDMPASLFIIND